MNRQLRNLICNHFPPGNLGFIELDEGSQKSWEHLAWFCLKTGLDVSQFFNSDEFQQESRAQYARCEENTLVFSHLRKSSLTDTSIQSTSFWLTRNWPTSKRELWIKFQSQIQFENFDNTPYRPENAICELRQQLSSKRYSESQLVKLEMAAFHAAAEIGHIDVMKCLLESDADLLRDKDDNDNAAIHFAALAGNQEIVTFLLEIDQKVLEDVGFDDRTPLLWAARNGQTAIVNYLIKQGANLHSATKGRRLTALHLASKYGHYDVATSLLVKSLMYRPDKFGYMPIHYAAACGHLNIVKLFVENSKIPKSPLGFRNRTPIELAALGGHKNVVDYLLTPKNCQNVLEIAATFGHSEIVKGLVEKFANLRLTALEILKYFGNFALIMELTLDNLNRNEIRRILRNYRASRNDRSVSFSPEALLAFHEATALRDQTTIRALVFNTPTQLDLVVALRVSAELGDVEAVKRIIEVNGIGVDERHGDESCRTALIAACFHGKLSVVDYLLRKGADANAKSWNYQVERCERLAIHLAADQGHVDVIERLVSHDPKQLNAKDGAGDVCLRYAARSGRMKVLHLLVDRYGQDVDTPGCSNITPLAYASGAGQVEAVEFLLQRGADARKKMIQCYHERTGGFTALHFACMSGNLDIAELLVKRQSSLVDCMTEDGRNLLHWACRWNLLPLARYLKETSSFEVDTRGYHGRTPLMEAASTGATRIVEYLLDNGADIELRSWDEHAQMTALCFCFQDQDHVDTAELLLRRGAAFSIQLYNYLMVLISSRNNLNSDDSDEEFHFIERLPGTSHFK